MDERSSSDFRLTSCSPRALIARTEDTTSSEISVSKRGRQPVTAPALPLTSSYTIPSRDVRSPAAHHPHARDFLASTHYLLLGMDPLFLGLHVLSARLGVCIVVMSDC